MWRCFKKPKIGITRNIILYYPTSKLFKFFISEFTNQNHLERYRNVVRHSDVRFSVIIQHCSIVVGTEYFFASTCAQWKKSISEAEWSETKAIRMILKRVQSQNAETGGEGHMGLELSSISHAVLNWAPQKSHNHGLQRQESLHVRLKAYHEIWLDIVNIFLPPEHAHTWHGARLQRGRCECGWTGAS